MANTCPFSQRYEIICDLYPKKCDPYMEYKLVEYPKDPETKQLPKLKDRYMGIIKIGKANTMYHHICFTKEKYYLECFSGIGSVSLIDYYIEENEISWIIADILPGKKYSSFIKDKSNINMDFRYFFLILLFQIEKIAYKKKSFDLNEEKIIVDSENLPHLYDYTKFYGFQKTEEMYEECKKIIIAFLDKWDQNEENQKNKELCEKSKKFRNLITTDNSKTILEKIVKFIEFLCDGLPEDEKESPKSREPKIHGNVREILKYIAYHDKDQNDDFLKNIYVDPKQEKTLRDYLIKDRYLGKYNKIKAEMKK